MKLAYLINSYPLASHTFIRREIHALERQGFDITRFAMRKSSTPLKNSADQAEEQLTQYLLAGGIGALTQRALSYLPKRIGRAMSALQLAQSCAVGGAASKIPGTGGRGRHLIYWLEALDLARRCQEAGISHIHAHFGTNSALVAMLAAEIGELTFSFTVHGPEEFDSAIALSLPEKIARAKFCVAVSSFGRGQLYRWCAPKNWSKLHEIHCGIEPWAYAKPVPLPMTQPFEMLAIGRFVPQKGFSLLLDAVSKLPNKDWKLTILGDGDMRSDLAAKITALNLNANVALLAWQTEGKLQHFTNQAHVVVTPSFAEGLPMVLMEAMASQRPVIASAIAGIPELVSAKNGWTVPSGSAIALAHAIETAQKTPYETLVAMGEHGRDQVFLAHDIDQEAKRLADLFIASAHG